MARILLLTFALLWSAATLFFIIKDAQAIRHQWPTNAFSPTPGIIDRIQKITDAGGDSDTYTVDLAYHYTINGQLFNATRLRYDPASSSDNWAAQYVQQHPAGSPVTVFYNPASPAESVLIKGLEGRDFFNFIFMAPFTAVAIGAWTLFFRSLFSARGFSGLAVREQNDIITIRPAASIIVLTALAAAAGSAFILIFITSIFFGGSHPTIPVVITTALIIAAAALTAPILAALLIRSGKWDITLDHPRKILRLRRRQIPYDQIQQIEIEKEIRYDDGKQTTFIIHLRQINQTAPQKICQWSGPAMEPTARRFALYLATQLNIPALDPNGNPLTPS